MRYFADASVDREARVSLPDGGEYTIRVFDGKEAALASMREQKIRTTSLLEAKDEPSRRYFVFFAEKGDPMVEELLIPGHPFDLAALCVNRARLYEWASVGAFSLCYAINLVFALVLFGLWIVR
jgi:hypothetical protein